MSIEKRIQKIKNESAPRANTAHRVGEALEGLKTHSEEKATDAQTASNQYTDGKAAEAESNAKEYTDDKASLSGINSVEDLRDININPIKNGDVVNLLGYNSPDDGGEGKLRWVASSTSDDDGGMVFKPNSIEASVPGRWKRFRRLHINVKWFGARGVGASGVDESIPIQKAIDYVADKTGGGLVFVPEGRYFANPINLRTGIDFYGVGRRSEIILMARELDGTIPDIFGLIQVDGNTDPSIRDITIRDLFLDGNKSNITGDLTHRIQYEIIDVESAADVHVRNVTCRRGIGDAIDFDNCSRVWVDSCRISEMDISGITLNGAGTSNGFVTNNTVLNCNQVDGRGSIRSANGSNNHFIGNTANNQLGRNYNISGSNQTALGNSSLGNAPDEDIWEGVVRGGLQEEYSEDGTRVFKYSDRRLIQRTKLQLNQIGGSFIWAEWQLPVEFVTNNIGQPQFNISILHPSDESGSITPNIREISMTTVRGPQATAPLIRAYSTTTNFEEGDSLWVMVEAIGRWQ